MEPSSPVVSSEHDERNEDKARHPREGKADRPAQSSAGTKRSAKSATSVNSYQPRLLQTASSKDVLCAIDDRILKLQGTRKQLSAAIDVLESTRVKLVRGDGMMQGVDEEYFNPGNKRARAH